MASKKGIQKAVWLSCTVALTAMVGCQAAPVIKGNVETTVNKGTPTAVTPPDSKPADPQKDPGSNPKAADPNDSVDNSNDGALDRATVMHIKASEGGVYVSDDGLLKAVFPPGSLSRDTDVRLVRVDTSKLKNSDVFLNGIRYQWDLGDAYIMPGTKVTITSKADDRLVPALKSMYTDFTMERYSLSKDDNGNYMVTMSYKGSVDARPPLTGRGEESVSRGTMQEGSFPVTPKGGAGEFKQDSRIEAFCNYQPPPHRAWYGNFDAHVVWKADAQCVSDASGTAMNGADAYAPAPSDPTKDSRVYVLFSTSFVNAPLPPSYNVTDTIPAVPAEPEVDTDQFGNIIANKDGVMPPSGYMSTVNQANDAAARKGTYVDFCGNKVTYAGSTQFVPPGPWSATAPCFTSSTSTSTSGGGGTTTTQMVAAQFNLLATTTPTAPAQQRLVLLQAVSGQAAQQIVNETNVQLAASDGGHYVTGGHPYTSSPPWGGPGCNCAPYVTQDDGPVIKDTNVFTNSAGVAHTEALQSYNSTNCSAGICAGGQVNFWINAQAHTRYPDKASNSDGAIGLYGNTAGQDSAAGRPLELSTPKDSPFIRLNLTDSKGAPYSGKLVMEYTINGKDYTTDNWSKAYGAGGFLDGFDWSVPSNTTGTVLKKFYMPGVTDDNDWTLKINAIHSDDFKMVAAQADLKKYLAFALRRNNLYTLTLDMVLNEAK